MYDHDNAPEFVEMSIINLILHVPLFVCVISFIHFNKHAQLDQCVAKETQNKEALLWSSIILRQRDSLMVYACMILDKLIYSH